jgi:hypothetical protein
MSLPDASDPAVPVAARCIDCRAEVPEELIFRVLRRDRAGRRHVVCRPCADRRHAEAQPTPLQVHRLSPNAGPRGLRGERRGEPAEG